MAALDWRPWLRMGELRRVSALLAWEWSRRLGLEDAEVEKWVSRVSRTYRLLSGARVLGRLRVSKKPVYMLLVEAGDAETGARLLAMAALRGAAGALFASREGKAFFALNAVPGLEGLLRELAVEAKLHFIARSLRTPLPFTLYNPRTRRWEDEEAVGDWLELARLLAGGRGSGDGAQQGRS